LKRYITNNRNDKQEVKSGRKVQEMRKIEKEEGMRLGKKGRKEGQEEIKTETIIKKRHRKACGRKRRKGLRRETKKTGQEDIQRGSKYKLRNRKK